MSVEIKWKIPGIHKVDPVAAKEELDRIRITTGKAPSPKDIVEASRDESAVLHPEFEWDDSVAGEKFREVQARDLSRNLVKVIRSDTNPSAPVKEIRAVYSVVEDGNRGYVDADTVLNTKVLRTQLLRSALMDLEHFETKYHTLSDNELPRILFDAIAETLEKVKPPTSSQTLTAETAKAQ